ncbi:hypothetical protein HHI36_023817 [Cryptolaemus montrouzieri]|uniref:Uncharacterized protein n=1 Tax=Cryptolaemus montrouzieri TaxID=559131 RepID=A0ABD2PHJ4_9CUCU
MVRFLCHIEGHLARQCGKNKEKDPLSQVSTGSTSLEPLAVTRIRDDNQIMLQIQKKGSMPDISIFQAKLAPAKEYLQTLEPTAGLENHIDKDIIAQIFQDTHGQKDIKNILKSHRITDTEYLHDILGNLHGILNDRSIKGRITKLRKKMFSAPSDAILSEDDYTTDSSQNHASEKYGFFENLLTKAISISTLKRKSHNLEMKRNPVAWWDEECNRMKRLRRASFKRWQHCETLDNLMKYKDACALANKIFNKKKIENFKIFA